MIAKDTKEISCQFSFFHCPFIFIILDRNVFLYKNTRWFVWMNSDKVKTKKSFIFFLFPQAMNCYLSSFIPFVHQAYFYFQGYLQVSFIWISCWLESKSSSFLINYTCIQNIIHVLFPISKRRSLHLNVSKECNKDASRLVLFSLLRVLFIIFGALGQCASEWQKVIKRFI